MNTSAGPAAHKISPSHLGRDAYVYIRQSTQTQVMMNTESLARQYELVERAGQLGWHTAQVVTIDADLGRSGHARTGGRGSRSWSPMSAWGRSGSSWGSRCRATGTGLRWTKTRVASQRFRLGIPPANPIPEMSLPTARM